MNETTLNGLLTRLTQNYNVLKEREAKFANAAPLSLLNQLDDYEEALQLTRAAIAEGLPLADLQSRFRPLNLEIDTVVFVSADPPPRKPFTGRNPYRGLRKFTEDAPDFFFGRASMVADLLALIKDLVDAETSPANPDLVAVIGPSGSGKSSMVRAGIIPALRRGDLPSSDTWLVKVMVPGEHPLDEVSALFTETVPRDLLTLRAELNGGERVFHQLMIESLGNHPPEAIFVLVIDQFEEVFTLCHNKAERYTFLKQLCHISQTRHNRGFIILTMRADFYGKIAEHKYLADIVTQNQRMISPMLEKELREAILLPAETVGLELEKALVEVLVNDTLEAPGALPLLQHTLQELFRRREGNLLTLAAYRQLNGVKGAIAHQADEIVDALSPKRQDLVRRIFLRLVQIGDQGMTTRRRATISEVLTACDDDVAINDLIQILVEANLIITGRNPENNAITLDVAHESLIREWPRFQMWLQNYQQSLFIHQNLRETAREWAKHQFQTDYLYRGARLLEIEEWLAVNPEEFNPHEADFVTASIHERDRAANVEKAAIQREMQRNRRMMRFLIGASVVITIGFCLMALGAGLGFRGARQAQVGQHRAQTAEAQAKTQEMAVEEQREIALIRLLAARSTANLGHNPPRSLLLAVQALNNKLAANYHLIDDEEALRETLAHSGGLPLTGHQNMINAVALSSDGRWLATASKDETVHLRAITAGQPALEPLILSHTASVLDLAFSPDSQWLATGSDDDGLRLWPLDTNQANQPNHSSQLNQPTLQPLTLSGQQGGLQTLAFSPDGDWLATANADGLVRVWQIAKPTTPPLILSGHTARVSSLAFSPDGAWLATASWDGTTRLWGMADLQTGESAISSSFTLNGHQGLIFDVAISPNGAWLATASADKTVYLWSLRDNLTEASPFILADYEIGVNTVAFSPQGDWLATTGDDVTARLWDLRMGRPTETPYRLTGHTASLQDAIFSPQGDILVTISDDMTARLWSLTQADPTTNPVMLRGHEDWLTAVAFSVEGRWLLTGSADYTARWWDIGGGQPESMSPLVLRGHQDFVQKVTFRQDGRWLASAGGDGLVGLWALSQGAGDSSFLLPGHTAPVIDLNFSPDQRWLVSASTDGTARVWDVNALNPAANPIVLSGHTGAVNLALFNPTQAWLLTADNEGLALLWPWRDNSPATNPIPLNGHRDAILGAAFSLDGRWLATASFDSSVRVWDMQSQPSPSVAAVFEGHANAVSAIAFSPAGAWLATASADQTVRLWPMPPSAAGNEAEDEDDKRRILRGHTDAVLALAFSPDGRWLATASADETARLWDLSVPQNQPLVLTAHEGSLTSIAFSQNGRWLATTSTDTTTRLWDLSMLFENTSPLNVTTVQIKPLTLRGHTDWVFEAAFSSDNQWLATVSRDQTVRLWQVNPADLVDLACRTAGRNLTYDEWQQAVGNALFTDKPYPRTCPALPLHPSALEAARALARQGDVEAAQVLFEHLDILAPALGLDPAAEVEQTLATYVARLLTKGRTFAQTGDPEHALFYFTEATRLEPDLNLNPQAEVDRLTADTAENLLAQGQILATNGDLAEAIAHYREVQVIEPDFIIRPQAWHLLCVEGSQHDQIQAQAALFACDQAITLAPENGLFYNSRGIVRLKVGDGVGATHDFEVFEAWLRKNENEE